MIDFLNSREDAILLWTVVIVGYPLYKDPRGVGGALLNVVRAFLHPRLMLLFGSALAYSALIVYAAERAGLWHTTSLKATVYWFAGTAVVLIGEAVRRAAPRDPDFIRRVLRRVVGVTILIELVGNLYVFPLAVELVGVGVAVVFTMLQVAAAHDASTDPRVRKLIDGVLAAVGFVYLGYFAIRGMGDLLDGAVGRDRVEEFLVGPVLTITLVPFLYAAAWWSRRERENLRRRFRARQARLEQTGDEAAPESVPDRLAS